VFFDDEISLIGTFVNGDPKGLLRAFDAKGQLLDMFYEDVRKHGHMWMNKNSNLKYLIYTDGSFVKKNSKEMNGEPDTVVIPFDAKEDILVGTINLISGYLENVHQAIVDIIPSSKNFCSLELSWKLGKKENFVLYYLNETKIDLDVEPQCTKTFSTPLNYKFEDDIRIDSPVQHKFIDWVWYMTDYQIYTDTYAGFTNLFHMAPENSQIEPEKVRQTFISNLVVDSAKRPTVNMSIWNGPIHTWNADYITIDENMKLHGPAILNLPIDHFNDTGRHEFLNWSLKSISGTFNHGILNGIACLIAWQGQKIWATFKDGILHGPAFQYGVVPILMDGRGFDVTIGRMPNKAAANMSPHVGIGFVGRFKNGQVHGNFWAGMVNEGYLHGKADENGFLTGDRIAYIYPDGETAFFGRFENKFMKGAFNVDVLEYGCSEDGTMLQVEKFTNPLSEHLFYYEPSTNETFGGGVPLDVRDPYEVKQVKLGPSAIPNSGEGVIAVRDIPRTRMATMYSMLLYRVPDQTKLYNEACTYNTTKSDEYRRHCKKYTLYISYYSGSIDIPPEMDVNPLPNLGPKVNHHFRANNSVYMETEHPRWGLIQSVTPTRNIKAGEELFTYYGYGASEFPNDFPWYFETKLAVEREERLENEKKAKQEATTEAGEASPASLSQEPIKKKKKKKQKKKNTKPVP